MSATKWLSEIRLTTWDGFDGYWIPRGWSKEGPIKTQSRIDVPRGGASLTAGTNAIAGVAWAPTRGIDKVEVQVDDGDWQEARLGDETTDLSWRQWVVEWDAAHRRPPDPGPGHRRRGRDPDRRDRSPRPQRRHRLAHHQRHRRLTPTLRFWPLILRP